MDRDPYDPSAWTEKELLLELNRQLADLRYMLSDDDADDDAPEAQQYRCTLCDSTTTDRADHLDSAHGLPDPTPALLDEYFVPTDE